MQSINGSEKKDQLGILGSKAGMVKRPKKNCYRPVPLVPWRTSMQTQAFRDLESRSTVNAILKHVAKLSLYLSFNVYLYYSKIKTFMPRLSVRIIFFSFYLLIS